MIRGKLAIPAVHDRRQPPGSFMMPLVESCSVGLYRFIYPGSRLAGRRQCSFGRGESDELRGVFGALMGRGGFADAVWKGSDGVERAWLSIP